MLRAVLGCWDFLQPHLHELIEDRAVALAASHRRVGRLLGGEQLRVEPRMPPDLLGILVLLPVPVGVRR